MDSVLLSGTLPMLSPFPRKLVVFPWEVKGLLYSVLFTVRLEYTFQFQKPH